MPFQPVGHTRLIGLFCFNALLWTTIGTLQAAAHEHSAAGPTLLSQRTVQRPGPQRKRPKPVRIRSGWLVTQRGAARRSCGEPMELVTAEPVNRPGMTLDSYEANLDAQQNPAESSAQLLPAGFEVYVPYAPQALLDLQFSIQTEDYEELHREVLTLEPDSDRIFVTIPTALLEQPQTPEYRWFLEAKVQCYPPATSQSTVASDTEISVEASSERPDEGPTNFLADFYSLPLESSVQDAETSMLGGWIQYPLTER